MYPTTGYLVIQILLLLFFVVPGLIFMLWRFLATK